MKRILLTTNGSGYQIDKCLGVDFFKQSITIVVSDRQCGALDIASKHEIDYVNLEEKNSDRLNSRILEVATEKNIDYVISPGFTKIFRGELLKRFRNRILNCHPSILPAFRGFYDARDMRRKYGARQVFERTLDQGSRVTGNTIHVVTENVDDGFPVVVSYLSIPYGEDPVYTRHRLFIQECKCLLQLVSWMNQGRLYFDSMDHPIIKNARFDAPYFAPNLEDQEIIDFDLKFPY